MKNIDCTEEDDKIKLVKFSNQRNQSRTVQFDNYTMIDLPNSDHVSNPDEYHVNIDDHSQHDLKRNEDEDHIYAISTKQAFPRKNGSITPENEKQNQLDSIEE